MLTREGFLGKPIDFTYNIVVHKETVLKGYNSPHLKLKEAELDIEMAFKQLGIEDKLVHGNNVCRFDVRYVPRDDGYYEPLFHNLSVEHKEEAIPIVDVAKNSLWYIIKRLLRRIRVKR